MVPGTPQNGTAGAPPQTGRWRVPGPTGDPWIDELAAEECLELLRRSRVGRVSVLVEGFPVILPVNHRLIDRAGGPLIFLRTRRGTTIDRAAPRVAFQIDGFDTHHQEGWSVLVRGWLRHAQGMEIDEIEIESWTADRDTLLVIEPHSISGRRLHAAETNWPFHPHGYI